MPKLINFIAFQACWFANVIGAANGKPWFGPLVTMIWMVAHFATIRRHAPPGDATVELRVVLMAVVLGCIADSTLVLGNLLSFPEVARLGAPTTLWMVALWVCFAATLRHSLGWLRGRWLIGAILGAIGGPLAYLGGQALGAIELHGGDALVAVAVQYALATPVLLIIIWRAERDANTRRAGLTKGNR